MKTVKSYFSPLPAFSLIHLQKSFFERPAFLSSCKKTLMRKEFLQNVAGLFLVSFCYINVITSFWDKCLNKWEENHDLFSKVIGTRCMKVIGQTLQKFPQNIGQKCRLNKLLVTEFFMDAKKKVKKYNYLCLYVPVLVLCILANFGIDALYWIIYQM